MSPANVEPVANLACRTALGQHRVAHVTIPVDLQSTELKKKEAGESDGSQPNLHARVVVTKFDGSAWGRHLIEGRVRPTLEVLLIESPAHLRRKHDPASGLPLISL